MNRLSDTLRPDSIDVMKRLRAFSSKHGPSLVDGGYAAMNIFKHPEGALDSVGRVVSRVGVDTALVDFMYGKSMR